MNSTIYLLIVVIIIAILLLASIFLLVIVMGHPDDKNAAYFPKAVTIFGLWLSFASLLVLPYDVAVTSSNSSGVNVALLWQIVYIAEAILIAVMVPFAFFYYEGETDESDPDISFFDTQLGSAIKYTLGLAIVLTVLTVILYSYLNTAQVPVTRITYQSSYNKQCNYRNPNDCFPLVNDITTTWQQCATYGQIQKYNNNQTSVYPPMGNLMKQEDGIWIGCMNNYAQTCPGDNCITGPFQWDIPVSFPLYVICFVGWLGWFFFCMFAGVGFIALPMDLINDFRYRPVPISTKQYYEERTTLGRRAAQLLELGEKLQRQIDKAGVGFSDRRKNNNEYSDYEKQYYFLKKDYQMLVVAYQLKGGNPLFYIAKLICGLLGICLSLSWLLHIIIFMIPAVPINPFLNTLFLDATNVIPGFPLFGVICFAVWSFYLLMCVVFGNFKLGVRFLLFKMYPMEVGNTLMNAFLFNTWIILFTSLPAAQFCVYAFPYYTSNTQAQVMFGSQIRYMQFFKYFFLNNVFILVLIAISGLTAIYLVAFPNNKAKKVDQLLEKLAKSKTTSIDPLDIDLKIK